MDDTGGVTVRQGKGRKDRVTFVGARTRKQVLRYFTLECGGKPKPEAPLFTSQRGGGRLAVATLRQLTRRLRAATGVKNCKCHAFRRTMAIQSLRNGMNVYVLAKMLGHDGIDVLRYYLDILQDDVKAAAKSFGVVDNLL
jgi:site-specific recombinase XerD